MGEHHHDHSAHGGGHDHHHHAVPNGSRAFAIGVTLNLGFVIVEVIAGLAAHSLALVADAGHNLGDVLGLALAWAALWAGGRKPTEKRTYGFKRSSILAALANAGLLLLGVGAMALEAIQRFGDPTPPETGMVVWVAAAGILINGFTAWLFAAGREGDVNRRGAFLHMAADAGVSAGVIVVALVIGATGWLWLDPLAGLAIGAIIAYGTWSLLRESLDLALDAVPARIDQTAVRAYLAGLPGVTEVHDLHIWGMSTTETALTAHVVRPGISVDDGLLARVAGDLAERFGIGHTTLQVETDAAAACRLAPADVV